MSPLLQKKFVVTAGKGGVGKSIFSIVIAKWAASNGKRVLLCHTASSPEYSDSAVSTQEHSLQGDIRKIDSNLYTITLDPVAAREEFALMMLKNRLLHHLIFSNRYVNSFLDAVPGLSEWAMLGKATHYVCGSASIRQNSKQDSSADHSFDMVVFDSPATGHGLDMLRLPSAIVKNVNSGRMHQEAQLRLSLLQNPEKTAVLPVTIPEEIPVNETIELVDSLLKYKMPVFSVLINRTPKQKIDPGCIGKIEKINRYKKEQWTLPSLVHHSQYSLMQQQTLRIETRMKQLGISTSSFTEIDNNTFSGLINSLTRQFQASQASGVQALS
jgi:anion-transporting  ArsA/GET3 family ATPase